MCAQDEINDFSQQTALCCCDASLQKAETGGRRHGSPDGAGECVDAIPFSFSLQITQGPFGMRAHTHTYTHTHTSKCIYTHANYLHSKT